MRTTHLGSVLLLVATLSLGLAACGQSSGGGGAGGTAGPAGGEGGTASGGTSGGSGGSPSTGGTASGGTTGENTASGGASTGTGGRRTGSGGTRTGTGGAGTGGAIADAGSGSEGGSPGTPCTVGAWPAVDPALAGPYATVTETNVGPAVGAGPDGGAPVAFTMFRPKDLAETELCHPVVTWGNGTGATPSMYKTLLNHLATHGFVVIASDSLNVAQGNPPPMVPGVAWVYEQNDNPESPLYRRIDTTRAGATGHSQGGFATTAAGGDSKITTIAPLCGASTQRNLHGPALLLCGSNDTTVPCSSIQNAYNGISNQPVMLAENLAADHANWITFRGTTPSTMEVAVVAWMRVHLMGDDALRPWFYGADCNLCQDPAWEVSRKMMDE
ncbi:MAG: hypothetical protein JXP73_13180 [Deltaproteobacteria bacterium]|nr:hypothetical protein [Deltaproteobacteria bacterium]